MTEKRGPREAFRKMSASVSKKKKMTEERGPRDQQNCGFCSCAIRSIKTVYKA